MAPLTSSRAASRPTPAIRRSCDACTDAKVGCNKQKPTCSRCQRRGEPCIYSVSQRAGGSKTGRKRKSSHDQQATQRTSPGLVRETSSTPAMPPSSFNVDTASIAMAPNNPSEDAMMDLFPSDYLPFYQGNGSEDFLLENGSRSGQGTISPQNDFETALSSWWDCSLQNGLPLDHAASIRSQSTSGGSINVRDDLLRAPSLVTETSGSVGGATNTGDLDDFTASLFSQMIPDLSAGTLPSAADWLYATDSNSSNASSSPGPRTCDLTIPRQRSDSVISFCGCFDVCLALLQSLTPPIPTGASVASQNEPSTTFHSVMRRNDAALDTLARTLQCSNTHEHSILLILPKIVLKILGWYAAAAVPESFLEYDTEGDISMGNTYLQSPKVQLPSTVDLEADLRGEKPQQAACQLVFAKLAKVRRVVNQLSTKLQQDSAPASLRMTNQVNNTRELARDLLFDGLVFDTATNRSIMKNVDENIRIRLRALSQNLMHAMLEKTKNEGGF